MQTVSSFVNREMGAIKQKKNTIKLDLLYGIIIGINRNQGCTIKQLSSRAYWVKKKHLLALIKTAIEQGKINETSDGLYKVSILNFCSY